jgi:CBS domain containing-hemolysin-like protein
MLDLVGRVPDAGDSVEIDGFRLTALEVRGRRIGRVRIEPMAVVTAGDGDGDHADHDGHEGHEGG